MKKIITAEMFYKYLNNNYFEPTDMENQYFKIRSKFNFAYTKIVYSYKIQIFNKRKNEFTYK